MSWPWTLHPSEGGVYQPFEHVEPNMSRSLFDEPEPGNHRSGTLCLAARQLDVLFGWVPAWHLSLVLQYTGGESIEYEGAPSTAVPGAYGPIVVRRRTFRPRLDRRASVVAYVRHPDLDDWEQALDSELERLNKAAVPYNPITGPNSNTVIRTLLLRLWLPPLSPAAVAPGFDHEAL